jgi:hypothetical protein
MKDIKELMDAVLQSVVPVHGDSVMSKTSHYAVATIEALKAALAINGLSIFYEKGFYLVSGNEKALLEEGFFRRFLVDVAVRIGIDQYQAKYYRTINLMISQMIHG